MHYFFTHIELHLIKSRMNSSEISKPKLSDAVEAFRASEPSSLQESAAAALQSSTSHPILQKEIASRLRAEAPVCTNADALSRAFFATRYALSARADLVQYAIERLSSSTDADEREILRTEIANVTVLDPEPSIRATGVRALGVASTSSPAAFVDACLSKMPGEVMFPGRGVFVHGAEDDDPRVRCETLKALTCIGALGFRLVVSGLDDPDATVRSEALKTLVIIGQDQLWSTNAARSVLRCVHDDDFSASLVLSRMRCDTLATFTAIRDLLSSPSVETSADTLRGFGRANRPFVELQAPELVASNSEILMGCILGVDGLIPATLSSEDRSKMRQFVQA